MMLVGVLNLVLRLCFICHMFAKSLLAVIDIGMAEHT